jgi:hypothetical protein
MEYTVQMVSDSIIYIPSLIMIRSGIEVIIFKECILLY